MISQPHEEWVTLGEAAMLLRRAHKPRHTQSLYDRIRRGTLPGERREGKWYIPQWCLEELLREPYHRRGGRPRIKDTRLIAHRKTRRTLEPPDWAEAARLVKLPVEKRLRAGLNVQLTVRNLVRARIERQFPHLSRAEITLKVIEEFERDG